MKEPFLKTYLKSSVFESSNGEIFEFENILKIYVQHEGLLDINLYAGISIQLTNSEDIQLFKIWYNLYLESKYEEKFSGQEEIKGQDLL